jgi:hypothetical protein
MVHRFNEKSNDEISSKIHKQKPIKITDDKKKIVEISNNNPRNDMGYHFPNGHYVYLLEDSFPIRNNLVDSISHTEIRNILSKHRIRYRQGNHSNFLE